MKRLLLSYALSVGIIFLVGLGVEAISRSQWEAEREAKTGRVLSYSEMGRLLGRHHLSASEIFERYALPGGIPLALLIAWFSHRRAMRRRIQGQPPGTGNSVA